MKRKKTRNHAKKKQISLQLMIRKRGSLRSMIVKTIRLRMKAKLMFSHKTLVARQENIKSQLLDKFKIRL